MKSITMIGISLAAGIVTGASAALALTQPNLKLVGASQSLDDAGRLISEVVLRSQKSEPAYDHLQKALACVHVAQNHLGTVIGLRPLEQ